MARRYLLVSDFDSDAALSVLGPVLEEMLGYGPSQVRALFDRHGLVIQEWNTVRTDWLTIRESAVADAPALGSAA